MTMTTTTTKSNHRHPQRFHRGIISIRQIFMIFVVVITTVNIWIMFGSSSLLPDPVSNNNPKMNVMMMVDNRPEFHYPNVKDLPLKNKESPESSKYTGRHNPSHRRFAKAQQKIKNQTSNASSSSSSSTTTLATTKYTIQK